MTFDTWNTTSLCRVVSQATVAREIATVGRLGTGKVQNLHMVINFSVEMRMRIIN
jgi:UDP-galactopyranose mutase